MILSFLQRYYKLKTLQAFTPVSQNMSIGLSKKSETNRCGYDRLQTPNYRVLTENFKNHYNRFKAIKNNVLHNLRYHKLLSENKHNKKLRPKLVLLCNKIILSI